MSARLGPSKDTINRTLHKLHFISKQNPQDLWIWKRIVTGDEKWIYLRNPDTRRQWVSCDKVAKPGIEVHPAYSPDIAPSDYPLFQPMATFLWERHFKTFQDVEIACREFFDSKPRKWYHQQIENLAKRWLTVIENYEWQIYSLCGIMDAVQTAQ
ncbi:NR6A1, partial [Cordylochernes scorpioides]